MKSSDTEQKQKDYYDRIGQKYDHHFFTKHALIYRNNIYDNFLKAISLQDKEVLDAMCGGGENSQYFLRKGAKLTGLDISETQCSIYKQRFPESKIVCTSIFHTGLPSESFDFVISGSLHHLHPEVNRGVKELVRLLKRGGYLLVWEPSAGSVLDLLRKLWYRLDETYFERNEASIDIMRLRDKHHETMDLLKYQYGGNVAYLLIQNSMHFRISPGVVKYYARSFLAIDGFLQRFQTKLTSCWVIALFRKKAG